jgi:hypothetical protein
MSSIVIAGASSGSATLVPTDATTTTITLPNTTGTLLTNTTLKGLGFGGETWHDVTASRAASTTYTNSNAYPIMVNIWGINSGVVTLTIGGVAANKSGINSSVPSVNLTGIVPPGLTYSISACSTLYLWSELY